MYPSLLIALIWILPCAALAGSGLEKSAVGDLLVARTQNDDPAADPWRRLQALYLPFTWQMEKQALKSRHAAKKVRQGFYQRLSPYRPLIQEAARRFNIPEAVIGAVIMVESAGNSRAKAKTSSAKGLMPSAQPPQST